MKERDRLFASEKMNLKNSLDIFSLKNFEVLRPVSKKRSQNATKLLLVLGSGAFLTYVFNSILYWVIPPTSNPFVKSIPNTVAVISAAGVAAIIALANTHIQNFMHSLFSWNKQTNGKGRLWEKSEKAIDILSKPQLEVRAGNEGIFTRIDYYSKQAGNKWDRALSFHRDDPRRESGFCSAVNCIMVAVTHIHTYYPEIHLYDPDILRPFSVLFIEARVSKEDWRYFLKDKFQSEFQKNTVLSSEEIVQILHHWEEHFKNFWKL